MGFTYHSLDKSSFIFRNFAQLLRHVQTEQAVVHLSSDGLGAHQVVKEPSLPEWSNHGIKDRVIVWPLSARLVYRDERVLDV